MVAVSVNRSIGPHFFFRKTYFYFLTDLEYTGKLIAGSLSAFIS